MEDDVGRFFGFGVYIHAFYLLDSSQRVKASLFELDLRKIVSYLGALTTKCTC